MPPDHAELAIAAVLSSLKTNMEREFSEARSKLHACGASLRSGFAVSEMKTLREMVSSFQDKCFPKNAKKNPHVGATPTEGTSHQAGTSGVTIRDDAMRPAVTLLSAVVSDTRPVRKSTNRPVRQSSAIPLVTKGQTFDTYGTIVGANHEKNLLSSARRVIRLTFMWVGNSIILGWLLVMRPNI